MESADNSRRSTTAEMWGKFKSLGGPRHIIDGAAPAVGFLIGYATANAKIGVLIALAVACAIAGFRLVRGDSARVVLTAVAVVVVFSLFVGITGEGRGFYLPDLLICAVGTVAFGASLLVGRPLSHWACTRIGLEPAESAARPTRIMLHRKVTFAWFVFWALHLVVMVPLYIADKVVVLGTVALVFGKPALVVMLAGTWLWVRRSLTSEELEGVK
ncbi:DUF3159 domain-containing protein [Nocardia uniformis]|uniref:DUF3159 domain-containing protein n=1 Tax=Nocardia uniformis TaxID=53432 RepID=A0A849C131_9NOCA|nr:DUF3159 domain-containing protein [Nocardia uniformis]